MANNWFRHDTSAHLDEKMIVLRKRHGWESVGVYWLLVGLCYESEGKIEGYKLPIIFEANEIPNGPSIFSTMVELRLFQKQGEDFTSSRVTQEIAKEKEWREARSQAGRAGGQASAQSRLQAKKPTTVEPPSSSRQRPSTISTTDRTVPTVPTLPNQAGKKLFTDDEIRQMEKPFLTFATDVVDEHYAAKTWEQGLDLPRDNKNEFARKVNVMLNSAKHQATIGFAKKMFHEIAGMVNDFGDMARHLSDEELSDREEF